MRLNFNRPIRCALFIFAIASALLALSIKNAAAGFAASHDPGTKLIDDKVMCDVNTPMAHYNFHTQEVSLNIMDTPIGYTPPLGPDMHFTVTYNQQEVDRPDNDPFPLPGFGPKWVCNWIAYFEDSSFNPDRILVRLPGGGSEFFRFTDGSSELPALQSGASVTQVKDAGGNVLSYVRRTPDGSQQVFDRHTPNPGGRRWYMTKLIDPTGKEANFHYDPITFRLLSVTDALNQSFTIEYWSDVATELPFYYLIKSVKDFALRTATFYYDSQNRLTKIQDAIGIISEFRYNETGEYANDFITRMITPYGETRFSQPSSVTPFAGARTLQAIEPDGGIVRLEYQQDVPGVVDTGIPASDPNLPEDADPDVYWTDGNFHYRNSFYWDKKAMAMYPPDENGIPQFSKAKITHWLHLNCAPPGFVSNIKEREKMPLENPVYYRYFGQGICEAGSNTTMATGERGRPSIVARRLDDGTGPHVTQLSRYKYNNPFQKLTEATDPAGRVTSYVYDPANHIDLIAIFQRNPTGNTQDPGGFSADLLFSSTYNDWHQPLIVTDAAGQTTTYTYTASRQLETVTNAKTEVTSYEYGDGTPGKPVGYLTAIISPSFNGLPSTTTSFTYDYAHRVHTVTTSPDNYTVTTEYDNLDRPTQITYPDGTTEQFEYADSVRGMTLDLTASKDRLNRWTYRHYNANRQMDSITDPETRTTHYDWCACGGLEKITDPKNQITTFHRDLQGRVHQKVFADNSTINYLFEGQTGPNTVGTSSRLEASIDALNRRTSYSYLRDNNVSQVSYTNASGAPLTPHTPSVNFTYDPNYNRIAAMDDGTGHTEYHYYPITSSPSPSPGAGQLQTVDGPLDSDTITFNYDELGRRLGRSVNGVAETVAYDSLGRLTTTDNALGHFERNYDGVTPRLLSVVNPNSMTTSYAYFLDNNDDRRLQTLEHLSDTDHDARSKFDYTYDDEGQITSWIRMLGANTSERWFEYDDARQLLSARNAFDLGAATQANGYGYDPAGNRTSDSNLNPQGPPGNGTSHSYTPNSLNQIETAATDGPSGFEVTLSYDLVGNLTDDGEGKTFEWDAANRLTAINYSGGQRTEFAYDGLGRRVKITEYGPGVTATIQPNGTDFTAFSAAPFSFPAGNYSLLFEGLNNSGDNMLFIDGVTLNDVLVGNGGFETPAVGDFPGGYQYNPINVTWSFLGNSGVAHYSSEFLHNGEVPEGKQAAFIQNDGEVHQIQNVTPGTYTLGFYAAQSADNTMAQQVRVNLRPSGAGVSIKRFVWCGSQICEERNSGGWAVTKRFFAEGEQRIGGSDAGNYYYTRDHLGSIREVTNSAGRLKARYDYDPYGKAVVVDGNMSVDFGYTGHYFHAPSGLNLTLYRAYNPALGRWLSRDPVGEAGAVNLYGYVGNDPINLTDPLGLFERDVHEGAPGQTFGTYTWARELGISDQAAKIIGSANIGVDTLFPGSSGAMPWSSKSLGRSRHFDIPLGAGDSRDAWAWAEMRHALDLWKNNECEGAFEALGRGLHSIQDAFAHGAFDNDHNPWKYHGSAMDNWAGRPDLHGPVERATKGYLQYFMNSLPR